MVHLLATVHLKVKHVFSSCFVIMLRARRDSSFI